MSQKVKGYLRILLPALGVGVLLSLLFLAVMNGPLGKAPEPTASPAPTAAAEETDPAAPDAVPEPTQPPDALFAGMTKDQIESSPWMMVAYAVAIFGGIGMARRIKNRSAAKGSKKKK